MLVLATFFYFQRSENENKERYLGFEYFDQFDYMYYVDFACL